MENQIIFTSANLITALTELLNSSFFTTLLGFILGLSSQIILSKMQENRKKKKDEAEFSIFEEMIWNDYVTPFHKILEDYSKGSGRLEYSKLTGYTKSVENRLIFLKEQEITFLNSDNQFKMVRLIEFTKTYFKEVRIVLNFYTFKPLNASAEEYDKDKKIQEKNIEILKVSYEKNREKYMDLKTDILFLQEDLVKPEEDFY